MAVARSNANGGAVPDWCAAHVLTSIAVAVVRTASALRNAPCFVVKSHCHCTECVHACVSAAGVHMCVAAPHMMSMVQWCRPAATCTTMRHTRRGCPMHMHARHACSVRTSTLHVGGCMFLAEPAMFLLTWCFCCSGQCFCFVFARRANVFACVWSQI